MVGLWSKVSVQLNFWKKTSFWESVSFHHEMFCVTNFLLVVRICIVNAMIFIKKSDKLVQDQFLQHVKNHPFDKFGYVRKSMPFFLFKQTKTKFSG